MLTVVAIAVILLAVISSSIRIAGEAERFAVIGLGRFEPSADPVDPEPS